jgi:ParB-like chromosome segregation protein Spo0J
MPQNYRQEIINRMLKNSLPEPNSGCWIWMNGLNDGGYGNIGTTLTKSAPRASYWAFRGPIAEGMLIRHLCNNPACVNPDHLEQGTHWDNAQDRIKMLRGEKAMTSGTFRMVPIESIRVNRDQRQRKELAQIDVLADSIHRLGVINPLTITRSNDLVAGERRLAALRMLGRDQVPVQYIDEQVDEFTTRAIELEENIKRLDLTWQEQCRAVIEYHSIRLAQEPQWSKEDTGKFLGLTYKTVLAYLQINKEAEESPQIMEAPLLSTAQGMVARASERRADKEREQLRGFKIIENDAKEKGSIVAADFTEWVKTYEGPRFNFLHCDFPYGIGTDKRQQGNAVAVLGGYNDTPDAYFRLLGTLCDNITRICTDSAHIMFWFSMRYYHDTLEFFSAHSDFSIDPFPLVWLKSDGVGLLPDPQRGPRRIYETCLFGSRGDRKIVSSVANAFASPTDIKDHVSTKPEPVLHHFFRMFVDENSVVLDPTCGSGSALRAAKSLGAGHILGIEINAEFADQANRRMRTDAI